MAIDEGNNIVEKAFGETELVLSNYYLPKLVERLVPAIIERARKIPPFEFPDHHVRYGPENNEITVWCLSILLAERTAGLLASKSKVGHCNAHRKEPDLKPCPEMVREHLQMLRKFREDIESLVTEIKARENELKSLVSSD